MEKEYFKKYLEFTGEDSLLSYEQFSLLNPGEEGDKLTARKNFTSNSDQELEVTDQLRPSSYGSEDDSPDGEVEESVDADEIPEHEGLVAAYFREMLRYSILSPEEERDLGRIIKHGQEGVLQLVLNSSSDLEEIKYLQKKVQHWFATPEKSAQAKEKLFRLIHQVIQRILKQNPGQQEMKDLLSRSKPPRPRSTGPGTR